MIGIAETAVRERDVVGRELQSALVDLVALALDAKQAHWHVTGPRFLPVHEQLDRLVDDVRDWSDLVAERSVALGVPVDGRPETVAGTTRVGTVPEGYVADDTVVRVLAQEVEGVVLRLRAGLDRLGELDPVSQDLVIEVLRGLEKHLWMLRAQAA